MGGEKFDVMKRMLWDQISSDQTRPDQTRPDQIQSNPINQIRYARDIFTIAAQGNNCTLYS
ncbi:hypothetical protein [Paenibacillus odorifer]|uniref:hypothetical protein n=1 Tax=Paenibacillus odorifer TaxID=189426 RepID=UPI0004F6670C|nr:hypothetical protein [Paenibacillus odorifer]AIQ73930.1 hypothetical protein PODO_12135 [Paenibacillus odorifer]